MQNNDGLCVCFLSGPIAWEMRGKASGQPLTSMYDQAQQGDESLTSKRHGGQGLTPESDF